MLVRCGAIFLGWWLGSDRFVQRARTRLISADPLILEKENKQDCKRDGSDGEYDQRSEQFGLFRDKL